MGYSQLNSLVDEKDDGEEIMATTALSLQAATCPRIAFHEPVELIRKAWALAGQPDKAKIAINSAIGMCGSRDNATYSAVLSDNRKDSNLLSGQVTEQQCGDVHMWTCKTKLVQNLSSLPCLPHLPGL